VLWGQALVDGVGDDLFPGACLPHQQDRVVHWRDLMDDLHDVSKPGISTDVLVTCLEEEFSIQEALSSMSVSR